MPGDILYKLLRKSLPGGFYGAISRSVFGRDKNWKRIGTYSAIFDYYRDKGLDFSGKTVLEVGGGDQLYTSLFFLKAGARKVLLVEPKLELTRERLAPALERFTGLVGGGPSLEAAMAAIHGFKDLSEIPPSLDRQADLILSHLVLEHFHDLDGFFSHVSRLLSESGVSHNRVDLSDHTYHVFGKYPLLREMATKRSLHHLRYPEWVFGLVNDPKCYMNRRLLPEYMELSARHGLRVENLSTRMLSGAKVHADLLARHRDSRPEDFRVVEFSMDLRKQGGGGNPGR